jgi:diacylglycerol kinase
LTLLRNTAGNRLSLFFNNSLSFDVATKIFATFNHDAFLHAFVLVRNCVLRHEENKLIWLVHKFMLIEVKALLNAGIDDRKEDWR